MMMAALLGMSGSLEELLEAVPFGSLEGTTRHSVPLFPAAADAVVDSPCVERSFEPEEGHRPPHHDHPKAHRHRQGTRCDFQLQQMCEAESSGLMPGRLDQTPRETMDSTVPVAHQVRRRCATHSCPEGKT